MKLHFNSEDGSLATARKLRSVVSATQAKVEELPYKLGDDVSKISFFKTLPLLQTPEGTFFSSNTIIRFLASSFKNDLYGGENSFNKSLVDQWLDLVTCEFESTVRGISRHQAGEKIDFGKLMEDTNKFLAFLEKYFSQKKFLVGESFSIADFSLASNLSIVFGVMFGQGQRKKYPNTLAWYLSVANSNKDVGPSDLPKEAHEAFKGGKKGGKDQKPKEAKQTTKQAKEGKGNKKNEKKQQKKEQATAPAPPAEDDLFGDDPQPVKVVEAPKPKKQPKKKPVAKSIVVFDVKVYEEQTDLNVLFQKIINIKMDGLTWNQQCKLIEIAFGMKKLQVGCVIEDDKISTEDLFETIQGWPEVQSTDTVSFNKL